MSFFLRILKMTILFERLQAVRANGRYTQRNFSSVPLSPVRMRSVPGVGFNAEKRFMNNEPLSLAGKKIHFMGAGGIGVSALAHMARLAGADVTACDRAANAMTRMLENAGVKVELGHAASHAEGIDLLVHTSAVPADHPERAAAPRQERRGRFLARIMAAHPSLGVCGTHGKTTTSWLLAQILLEAGLDPSVYIGGVAAGLSFGNHRLGTGPFVAELDESDGTFLLPRLDVAVMNNVESDHLSHYGTDEKLIAAFRDYARGVEANGVLVAGVDNETANAIFTAHAGKKAGFAIDAAADYQAVDIEAEANGSAFSLAGDKAAWGRFSVPMPGGHNILNALAAAAAAVAFGVAPEIAKQALAKATGVERRMEELGRWNGAVWYTDYAHHPSEVAAAISGLRQKHAGGVMVVFQPHLYSRTRDYADRFAKALSAADRVLVVDIYPAREKPIPGVSAGSIAAPLRTVHADAHGPVPLSEVAETANRLSKGMEAVVMMGAGDIDDAAREMALAEKTVKADT